MWSLDLAATFERPDGLKNRQWRFHGRRDGCQVAILREPTTLTTYDCRPEGLESGQTYRVPAEDRWQVALHPSGREAALATPSGVHLLSPEAGRLLLDPEALGGQPKGAMFGQGGDLLWVTYENERGESHVCAIEYGTLEIVGALPVPGMPDSLHTLRAHPSGEVLALEVSCGQDGTWLTLVELRDRSLRLLLGVERPGQSFTMAGFVPSGRWLSLVSPERIEHLSWPDLSRLAEIPPPGRGEQFDWPACYVGERFVASTLGASNESYRLVVYGAEQKIEAILAWEKRDQGYLYDAVGLSDDRLLLFGDLRAGLFQLSPR